MRLVFFGTPASAVPSLRALVASRHDVLAVVTRPDRPRGRGRTPRPSPVKEAALELGLETLTPESVATREVRDALAASSADLYPVVAFGRLLGPKLLATVPRGAVNLHFSLLPRWRGAAPVQRAMLAGDAETGVTTMQLVKELDAGPIYLQESRPIDGRIHAPALEEALATLGARLLVKTIDGLEDGTLVATEQDPDGVTLAPPLRREEGWLEPERPAPELALRIRALDPWPGSRLSLGGGELAVLEADVADGLTEAVPGTLVSIGRGLGLACAGGSVLELRRARPAGKKAMTGEALLNGRHVRLGDRAGPPGAGEASPPGGGMP